jgi:HSP20 family protein
MFTAIRQRPDPILQSPNQCKEDTSMINLPARYETGTPFTRLPDLIDKLFRESFIAPTAFDRFFDGVRTSNLLETKDAFIVQLVLPGVDPEKIDIQVVDRQLLVKAAFVIPTVEHATYLYHALHSGEYSETFTLPMEVLGDKAEATYDRGILLVTLPKAEHAKPTMIEVHAR